MFLSKWPTQNNCSLIFLFLICSILLLPLFFGFSLYSDNEKKKLNIDFFPITKMKTMSHYGSDEVNKCAIRGVDCLIATCDKDNPILR